MLITCPIFSDSVLRSLISLIRVTEVWVRRAIEDRVSPRRIS